MKKQLNHIIILVAILMLSVSNSQAATPITGTAFGENIGLIHADYTTAISPIDPCDFDNQNDENLNCETNDLYNNYHIGLREDFYISPVDQYYSAGDPAFTATIADIGDDIGCNDVISDACLLSGFIWSNALGWIILDGNQIQSSIENPELFPSSSFAHVNYDGIFKGEIWSEKAGWIKLSSESFDKNSEQTATNFGVWMDPTEPEVDPIYSPNCDGRFEEECNELVTLCSFSDVCEALPISLGRHLYGYGWSEHLGWIQFEEDDENIGFFTKWMPDTTPPVINAVDGAWFANNSEIGTVTWPSFASDPESGIDLEETELVMQSNFAGCNATNIANQISLNDINIQMILAGDLSTATEGFCKYEITGKITNGAGFSYYITDTDEGLPPEITSDPLQYQPEPIIFYVRAGALDLSESSIVRPDDAGAVIADGKDILEYRFEPSDLFGNPILPVKVKVDDVVIDAEGNVNFESNPALWVRNTDTEFNFQADNFYFDSVNTAISPSTIPISIDNNLYDHNESTTNSNIIYSLDEDTLGYYPVQSVAYAPTNCASCTSQEFLLNQIDFNVDDAELPAVVIDGEVTSATNNDYEINSNSSEIINNPLPISYEFSPAVVVTDGTLNQDPIVVGVPTKATFNLNNKSLVDSAIGFAIDNLMSFENESDGIGLQVLDIRNIDSDNSSNDNISGRTDPLDSGSPRYALNKIGTKESNLFYNTSSNIHQPIYAYNSSLDNNDSYEIDGSFDCPTDVESENCPAISIDRGDAFSSSTSLGANASLPIAIDFTPIQFIGTGFTTDVSYNLDQYIAYKMGDSPFDSLYAVYDTGRTIDGINVKNLGLQATGIVTGSNVFDNVGGRDLDSITGTGSGNLTKQIRSNVASLTRNIVPCSVSLLSSLPTSGSCVKVDENNKTIVAVYEGGSNNILQIGDKSNDVVIPNDYKYTIIVKGGAGLFINSNLEHGTNTSFGMIVLADNDGNGGNVYISPNPTNIVGLLYSEGSIFSSPNGSQLYYGSDAANAADLKNQLYWQGSIVSKNTIGGTPSKTYPPGVDCYGEDPLTCAQIYDMDFLRRFVVKDGTGYGYIDNDAKFSGGGTCLNGLGTCNYGYGETSITLGSEENNNSIDMTASKSIDPFFIEKDNRPAPLGFTTASGFEQAQEIR